MSLGNQEAPRSILASGTSFREDFRPVYIGSCACVVKIVVKCSFEYLSVVVDKLLYADDLAENAKSEGKMQGAVDRMSKACDNFQLTISTKKTEVVHQPAPGKLYSEPTITVNGRKLQVVDKFTYLGSTLSRAVHIDDEVTARTAKASVAFGRLPTNVWERNGIRLDIKLKVYKAVVLPTLLYACETWTVYQRHAKKLNHFHLSA